MEYEQEPDIIQGSNPEKTFQKSIVCVLRKFLNKRKCEGTLVEYYILENFGLDIAIFMKWKNNQFTVRFFEVKAFVGSRLNGVGFGNQKGKGAQVDLLLLEESQLDLANQFVRWIMVNGQKRKGTKRFIFFNSGQAKKAAMCGVKKGKQNNFRVKDLMKNSIKWHELIQEIERFLMKGIA